MAFFRNTKPNSIAGISLPADGSDSVAIHLLSKGFKGTVNTDYEDDRRFLLSLPGARVIDTSSGCMVVFEGAINVMHMLDTAGSLFDAQLIKEVEDKRVHAQEDALRFSIG